MKVTCYVGVRDGKELKDIRKLDDLTPEERKIVSYRLQEQCATAIGYKLKSPDRMKPSQRYTK